MSDDPSEASPQSHRLEQRIQRELLDHSDLHFSSLVVRRIPQGVCLQGVLECDEETCPDVCSLVQKVSGVEKVLNRLVIKRPCSSSSAE